MEELERLTLPQAINDTSLNSDSSQWSVSAIVTLGDVGRHDTQPIATRRQLASPRVERLLEANANGDRIYLRNGTLIAARPSATIDLGPLVTANEFVRHVQMQGARRVVVLLTRPGDQSRFNVHLGAQPVERGRLYRVQQYILSNPAADLSVNALAKIAAMSVRNFTRVFKQEVGVSPSGYVDLTRVDVARFLLESSQQPIDLIAAKSGFGSPRTMRRAFLALIGATPSEYRESLGASGDGSMFDLADIG